jgi:hypothetical protein
LTMMYEFFQNLHSGYLFSDPSPGSSHFLPKLAQLNAV